MAFASLPCTQYKTLSVRHQGIDPRAFTKRFRVNSRRNRLPNFCMAALRSTDKPLQTSVNDMAKSVVDDGQFLSPSFADAVSGEWFGFECSFSAATGAPLCIEERYVPDEYRNWGVEIKGFEALTSSELTVGALRIKRTRVLPSVGCEADAVVPETSEFTTTSFGGTAESVGFANGSYCVGPLKASDDVAAKWSFCLVEPNTKMDKPRTRVRVECGDVLAGRGVLTVHIEVWDAPFSDGAVLPGCGGSSSSFADAPALDSRAELAGTWAVSGIAFENVGSEWRETEVDAVIERSADEAVQCVTVALPKGVSLNTSTGEDGAFVEVGWMSAPGVRTVMRRQYDEMRSVSSINWLVERLQGAT